MKTFAQERSRMRERAVSAQEISSTALDCAGLCCLAAMTVLLFVTAPTDGDFWWSDAPRHALNGVFLKDFIEAFPIKHPREFAIQYYVQYPALTILFYPPLFYLISAPFFALFGVSHFVAQAVVAIHYCALAWGIYAFSRFWLSPAMALAAATLFAGCPEIALWGRQVMLEIPAFSFAIWGAVFLVMYLRRKTSWMVYASFALLVLSIYTKLSCIFLLPVFGAAVFWEEPARMLRNRHMYAVFAATALSLAPLVAMTLAFGKGNIDSVVAIEDSHISRATLSGWLWYLRRLPSQIGWLPPLLAAAALLCMAFGRCIPPLRKREAFFLTLWLFFGYLFFSSIDLKEDRHSIFLLAPIAVFAVLLLRHALPPVAAAWSAAALAIGTFAYTLASVPVPRVDGQAEVAAWIAEKAPKNSVVLFWGKRDGAFVFNMRAHEERRDLTILRADKLLMEISIRRGLGVQEASYTKAEIGELLDRSGVRYAVAQSDFWTDLEQARRLYAVLESPQFERLGCIERTQQFDSEDRKVCMYKNKSGVAEGPVRLELSLPIIGRKFEGVAGGRGGD